MKLLAFVKHRLYGIKNRFIQLSWKKKAVVIIVLLIVLFIITSPLRPKKSAFTIENVTRGTVTDVVSESGNAQAASQIQVFSPSTGVVTQLFVKNGDTVANGENLFEVKSTATPDQKAQALATYLQAKTALDSANATEFSLRSTMYTNWKRFTDLSTNGTYQNGDGSPNTSNRDSAAEFQESQDNWFAAEANYKNQQTAVAQTEASLTQASLAYQATQDRIITSPLAGTVANLSATVGDQVTAPITAVTQSPVLYIGNFTKNEVKVDLNEVDVNKIKTGEDASLVFDAMRDTTYKGTVETIDTVGTNTGGVITYTTTITIANPDGKIKPSMTVTATIETSKHDGVLMVPNSAIKPYKGGKAVVEPGAGNGAKTALFHYVPVIVGLKGITDTEIVSGVSEGTPIITAGLTTTQLNSVTISK